MVLMVESRASEDVLLPAQPCVCRGFGVFDAQVGDGRDLFTGPPTAGAAEERQGGIDLTGDVGNIVLPDADLEHARP